MNLNLDTGTIVIVIAIAIFYARLLIGNFLNAKREANKTNKEIRRAQKEGRSAKIPDKPVDRFAVQVRSWWLVGISILIVMVGLVVNSNWFDLPAQVVSLYYVPVALGILLLAVAVK
jgi:hypothetical protein